MPEKTAKGKKPAAGGKKAGKTDKRYCKTLTLPDGTRKWIRAATKEELDAKVLETQVMIGLGIDLSNHDTFGECAQLWYDTFKKPYLQPNSLESIRSNLNTHIMPTLATIPVRDITPFMIQQIFSNLTGHSKSTNNIVYGILRQIFEMCIDNNLIVKSPIPNSLRRGGKRAKEKEALTAAQQQQLLDAVKGKPVWLFCLLGISMGLRRGELLGLYWSDLDPDAGIAHLRHNWTHPAGQPAQVTENMKTEASRRDIPIPAQVIPVLRHARAAASSIYVFPGRDGGPLTANEFKAFWQPAQQTGLHVTPHILRHTCATNLLEAGVDIKEIQHYMGHSTLATTLNVYTHYQASTRLQQTAEKVSAAFAVNL